MTTALTGAHGDTRRMGSKHNSYGNPWNALWAMMIGFFMIMLDSTIVAVVNPTMMTQLHIGYDAVIWVTSAYLLAYAVLLLVAGRLGDRFGPKNLYLIGLVVFTAASVWCGMSRSADMLIAARVMQGVGAGVLTPQTLSTITRIFPPERRGAATSVWGAVAGVAGLVGPLAGGVLVDRLGWKWIFFVNVPIGIVALVVAAWLVPTLSTHARRFDWLGVVLSGAGMFLIVFALQQGHSAHWQPWIWAVIVAGVGLMSTFICWQAMNSREPLIPLDITEDRNFNLCNVGVAVIAFATTGMMLPLTFYAQAVCGLSPTQSALLIAPLAITNGVLAPVAGMIVDRAHPLPVLGFGFSILAVGLTWLSFEMAPGTPIWRLVLPLIAIGGAMAFVWSPLTATAIRHLPLDLAGAGSGVFNTTRQLGAVLGSAGMAPFMTWRITTEMPPGADTSIGGDAAALQLPAFVRAPFAVAMSQSMMLPAFIALLGIVAALFLVAAAGSADDHEPEFDDGYEHYVEYILRREPDFRRESDFRREPGVDSGRESLMQPQYVDDDTEPLLVSNAGFTPAKASPGHPAHLCDVPTDPLWLQTGPTDFVHNEFHVNHDPIIIDHNGFGVDRDPIDVAYDGTYFDDGRIGVDHNGFGVDRDPLDGAYDGTHYEDDSMRFDHNAFHLDEGEYFRPISGSWPPSNQRYSDNPRDPGGYGRHSFRAD